MAVQVSYPGVYIEEFAPGAPIQGVSTSIPAFIGLASKGPVDKPTPITSWDQFKSTFGEQPVPGSYLWQSVNGFFRNEGQTCFVVRASNGTYSKGILLNQAGSEMVRVKARNPGATPAPLLQVEIEPVNTIDNEQLYRPEGQATALTSRTLTMADAFQAAQFRPGDEIFVNGIRARVNRVTKNQILLGSPPNTNVPAEVRLADLRPGDRIFRITLANQLPDDALAAGTALTISQNDKNETHIVASVQAEYLQTEDPIQTYRVTLRDELKNTYDLESDVTVQSHEINFRIINAGSGSTYERLGVDPAHKRFFLDFINENNSKIELEPTVPPPSTSLPNALSAEQTVNIEGGENENLSDINAQDYIDAIDTLRDIDAVTLVAAPGVTEAAVQQALIAHCEMMGDRFAVLDSIPGAEMFGDDSVEEQRRSVSSTRGFAALYYPWLRTLSAATGKKELVPPSGHICGIMTRVDNNRGVHKAPANEFINGALGVEKTMSNQEQGLLNLQGINVIRVFREGGRPVVWGARTTATDTNWQYINIRRLFLFLEESIQEGIEWAVFEPNNLQLWQKLKRSITDFLTRAWRDGALFGATREKAFYVRIDDVLNPFPERQLGRLNIEIGVQPTYPAEFIIVRIGIWDGGSEVDEG